MSKQRPVRVVGLAWLMVLAWWGLPGAAELVAPRPRLNEVFEAHGVVAVHCQDDLIYGEGVWVADNGKLLERVTFRGREHLNIHRLMLAKEGDEVVHFTLQNVNGTTKCSSTKEYVPIPALWSWIKQIALERTFQAEGQMFSLWRYSSGDKEYEVCVLFGRPEELRFLNVIERERMITYSIHKWRTGRPHESWFAIPKECS